MSKTYRNDWNHAVLSCPKCNFTSYDPDDIERGYCANCDDTTVDPVPRDGGFHEGTTAPGKEPTRPGQKIRWP